eukprot:7663935-Alexandrium_andersonii.AAC.1
MVAVASLGPLLVAVDNASALKMARAIFRQSVDLESKPWALRKDGDLWSAFEGVARMRGFKGVGFCKVKGHTTLEQVNAGQCSMRDHIFNGEADRLAALGRRLHPDLGAFWT